MVWYKRACEIVAELYHKVSNMNSAAGVSKGILKLIDGRNNKSQVASILEKL